MEVICGKKTFYMNAEEFKSMIAPYTTVAVEIGTGNGKFVYELAKSQPETFFIGIDADRSSLIKYSHKIHRKPERGGVPNVLYVIASVENLPHELDDTADTVWIVLPWGSLLRGVVSGAKSILKNIVQISSVNGILKMFISYSVKYEPVEMEKLRLPALTLEYIDSKLTPLYQEEGITITERNFLTNEPMKEIPSKWAKRLAYGRKRKTLFIEACIEKEVPP
ncbi:MAG: hypothetical protein AYK19_05230 [Theionarchaea archaeon DG-70-1]|nr:MAG: hypothetical protein AYK19_05230 [Theionarchaea archaeon DG-70-1]